MLKKGKVSSLLTERNTRGQPTKARIVLDTGDVSGALEVAEMIQGQIQPDTEVLYCIFEDGSGLILCRADGKISGGETG